MPIFTAVRSSPNLDDVGLHTDLEKLMPEQCMWEGANNCRVSHPRWVIFGFTLASDGGTHTPEREFLTLSPHGTNIMDLECVALS